MTDTGSAGRQALTLYINGASPSSLHALETVRRLCDTELGGHADLEVVDVQQQPALAARDRIVAVPTLIKRRPGPLRRIVGDLSDPGQLRLALGLAAAEAGDRPPGPGG